MDQNTVNQAQAKIDSFTFSSLWFSGLASLLSLVVGQYTAFKVDCTLPIVDCLLPVDFLQSDQNHTQPLAKPLKNLRFNMSTGSLSAKGWSTSAPA